MRPKYIPAAISLLAGAITCIVTIVKQNDVLQSLELLLVILIVFYILGCIARSIIGKVMLSAEVKKPEASLEKNQLQESSVEDTAETETMAMEEKTE